MDAELLTSVLRDNGHLGDATVVAVELTPLVTNGIGSEFYAAKLRYSSVHHRLPNRMVIKRPLQGDRGRGEANVYELILRRAPSLPIMGYFGVVDEAPQINRCRCYLKICRILTSKQPGRSSRAC